MPDTMTETESGTGIQPARRGPGRPSSNPIAKIAQEVNDDEPIVWVGREESERLETMIGKTFVRRTEQKSGDNKKYFYRIMSACPYVPGKILTMRNQSLVNFSIQKFHRNKFVEKKTMIDGRQMDEKVNEAVMWVEIDQRTGDSEVVDPDANFFMDSREFEKLFVRDTE